MIGAVARAFGIDPRTFLVLHRAFWTLSRRATSGLLQGRSAGKERSVAAGLWTYAIFGAMASMFALFGGPRDLFGTVVLGMTLILVGLAVVADFAAVVVAPGDDEILFHLPLSSRTYLAARLSVAARHTALLALVYAALPALTGALVWKNPLYAPLLLAAAVWTGWFGLVLAFVAYRVALKLFGGERLRTLLAYVPGVFSMLMAFGPQLLPSAARPGRADPEAWRATMDRVGLVAPPGWFSALAEAGLGAWDGTTLARAAIGLAVVPLGLWVLVTALGRGFLDDLQRLVSGKDSGPSRAPGAPRALPPGRLATALLSLRSPELRAGWLLYVGAMRSRASRARLFPVLAIPFVLVAVNLLRAGGTMGFMAPMGLYLVAATAGSLVGMLPYHEHKDAAWLFEGTPIRRFGRVYLGVLAAMLCRHVLPPTLAMAAVVIAIDPTAAGVGGALYGATCALLSTALVAAGSRARVPFAHAFQAGEQGGQVGIMLLNMLLIVVLGGIHAAIASLFPWAFLVTVPAMVALSLLWLVRTADALDRAPPRELVAGPLRRAAAAAAGGA